MSSGFWSQLCRHRQKSNPLYDCDARSDLVTMGESPCLAMEMFIVGQCHIGKYVTNLFFKKYVDKTLAFFDHLKIRKA